VAHPVDIYVYICQVTLHYCFLQGTSNVCSKICNWCSRIALQLNEVASYVLVLHGLQGPGQSGRSSIPLRKPQTNPESLPFGRVLIPDLVVPCVSVRSSKSGLPISTRVWYRVPILVELASTN
jgi:hypothetical protein